MKHNNTKTHAFCLAVFFSLCAPLAMAQTCREGNLTALEDVYCQIKAKGKGSQLPAFQQFRRNPESTQRLLLKHPARKMRIALPQANNKRNKLSAKPVIFSQTTIAKLESASDSNPDKTRPRREPIPEPGSATNTHLDQSCQLEQDLITCDARTYYLQTNRQNKHINSSALSPENRLVLPEQNNQQFQNSSVNYYLSETYRVYIEKMISIGLADATMSFTKFAKTHEDIVGRGDNFSGRFTKMFELLKKEKQTNAVKSRYNNNFPSTLTNCMQLHSALIVCDNVIQNWVYSVN